MSYIIRASTYCPWLIVLLPERYSANPDGWSPPLEVHVLGPQIPTRRVPRNTAKEEPKASPPRWEVQQNVSHDPSRGRNPVPTGGQVDESHAAAGRKCHWKQTGRIYWISNPGEAAPTESAQLIHFHASIHQILRLVLKKKNLHIKLPRGTKWD